jgi:hypothetical protein
MKQDRLDLVALGLAAAACLVAALLRIFPLEWNFAPVGALALFAGARLRGWLAFALPVVLMLCTDAVLAMTRGHDFIHEGTPWVYSSFLLAVLLGRLLARTENPFAIGGLALANSVLFFLVTNFGHWVQYALLTPGASGAYFDATAAGLAKCYLDGVPFYRGTLVGDLLFTAVLFGAHAWLTRALTAHAPRPVTLEPATHEVRRDH